MPEAKNQENRFISQAATIHAQCITDNRVSRQVLVEDIENLLVQGIGCSVMLVHQPTYGKEWRKFQTSELWKNL